MIDASLHNPLTEQQEAKLTFFGWTSFDNFTQADATDVLAECARLYPHAESAYRIYQYQIGLPATASQKEKLLSLGCSWSGPITVGQAIAALEKCLPATEMQKDKLRYFGCTWDGEITFAKARDALDECAKQFPGLASSYQNRPATDHMIEELSLLRLEPVRTLTCGEATLLIDSIKRRNAQRLADSSLPLNQHLADDLQPPSTRSSAKRSQDPIAPPDDPRIPPEPKRNDPSYDRWDHPAGKEYGFKFDHMRWEETVRQVTAQIESEKNLPATDAQNAKLRYYGYPWSGPLTVKQANDALKNYALNFPLKEAAWLKQPPSSFPVPERRQPDSSLRPSLESAAPLPTPEHPEDILTQDVSIQPAATLADAPENQGSFPPSIAGKIRQFLNDAQRNELAIPPAPVTPSSPSHPPIRRPSPTPPAPPSPCFRKQIQSENDRLHRLSSRAAADFAQPAESKSPSPIAEFRRWLDAALQRNSSVLGGHWIAGLPLPRTFVSDPFTMSLSRELAATIDSQGFCVEPDARFVGRPYDKSQTLALFKPLHGDSFPPSPAYALAANMLRLCIAIATADGKIDLVELESFREAIETSSGITRTDRKRLLILEQLLAQELSPSSASLFAIAQTVPANDRLRVGELLVQVAASTNHISVDQRLALDRIFKALEIPHETLDKFIISRMPFSPRPYGGEVLPNDRFLWTHWRKAHPCLIIDDSTLARKKWNFTDWAALNARWRGLHQRLLSLDTLAPAPLPSGFSLDALSKVRPPSSPDRNSATEDIHSARRSPSTDAPLIPIRIQAAAPAGFSLNMRRIKEITRETDEVAAILTPLMDDALPSPITLPTSPAPPSPEIANPIPAPPVPPPPARFAGLDPAFCPILERLLTRDCWPHADFDSLAREFHFMPLNIRDTLNEWSDDSHGDFILDGDDPIVVRRELITKETIIYG